MINRDYHHFRSKQEFVSNFKREFSHLTRQQQRFVLDNLSSRDRKMMVNIFKENITDTPWNSQKLNHFNFLVVEAKEKHYSVTQKDSSSSPVTRLLKTILYVWIRFLNIFGYLSSNQANRKLNAICTIEGNIYQVSPNINNVRPESSTIKEKKLEDLLKEVRKNENKDIEFADILREHGYSVNAKLKCHPIPAKLKCHF